MRDERWLRLLDAAYKFVRKIDGRTIHGAVRQMNALRRAVAALSNMEQYRHQAEIVAQLRKHGMSVQSLVPNHLLVGWRGRNILLEIRDAAKMADQKEFPADWKGQVDIVETFEQAWYVCEIRTRP
jgi:hypothetical protein